MDKVLEMTGSQAPVMTRGGLYKRLFFRQCRRLREGGILLRDGARAEFLGDRDGDLQVEVQVQHPRFYRRAVWGGGLGCAESLIDGDWKSHDLTGLVRLFIRNLDCADRFDSGLAWLRRQGARLQHAFLRNTRRNAARNIHRHYDLGNAFYQLFLDETMSYSCGIFASPDDSLQDASVRKLDRVCQKLHLQPGDHLLEIGTGWGGLALHAARKYGCRVTTTTISQEQFQFARQRIEDAGLAHRVTVLNDDYRDLTGSYDKLVSIEMIEAVGHQYWKTFFAKCGDLLRPDGMMLLQSIVIRDGRFRQHLRSVDFIRKYIFPGGCLPSISVLTEQASQVRDLRLLQLDDIAPHYALTLRHWRQQFQENLEQVREQGFDESFIRMWNYYLCYCEAAFLERQVNNVQMLMAKRRCLHDPLGCPPVEA